MLDHPPAAVITPMAELFQKRAVAAEYACRRQPGDRIPLDLLEVRRIIGDFTRGDYILLCGGDDIDPSSFALNLMMSASRHFALMAVTDMPLYFTLAKSARRIGDRAVSILTDIRTQHLTTGHMAETDFEKIAAVSRIGANGLSYRVVDAAGLDTETLRRQARSHAGETGGCGMIVVDTLDMVRTGLSERAAAQAEISRTLKEIAKETDSVVIGLASLPSLSSPPTLKDIRQAGYATREADIVASLFCEQHWLERDEPHRRPGEEEDVFDQRYSGWRSRFEEVYNTCQLTILAHVHGRCGVARLHWEAESGLVANRDHRV